MIEMSFLNTLNGNNNNNKIKPSQAPTAVIPAQSQEGSKYYKFINNNKQSTTNDSNRNTRFNHLNTSRTAAQPTANNTDSTDLLARFQMRHQNNDSQTSSSNYDVTNTATKGKRRYETKPNESNLNTTTTTPNKDSTSSTSSATASSSVTSSNQTEENIKRIRYDKTPNTEIGTQTNELDVDGGDPLNAKNSRLIKELLTKTENLLNLNIKDFLCKLEKQNTEYASRTNSLNINSNKKLIFRSLNKSDRFKASTVATKPAVKVTASNSAITVKKSVSSNRVTEKANAHTTNPIRDCRSSSSTSSVSAMSTATVTTSITSDTAEHTVVSAEKTNEMEIVTEGGAQNMSEENAHSLHPAPLPNVDASTQIALNKSALEIPPAPELTVESEKRQFGTAVVLTWEIPGYDVNTHEKVKEYELYGYRENDTENIDSDAWKMIGPIQPYQPPVKCTLTDFVESSYYHFAVRSKDVYDRLSQFSAPATIKI